MSKNQTKKTRKDEPSALDLARQEIPLPRGVTLPSNGVLFGPKGRVTVLDYERDSFILREFRLNALAPVVSREIVPVVPHTHGVWSTVALPGDAGYLCLLVGVQRINRRNVMRCQLARVNRDGTVVQSVEVDLDCSFAPRAQLTLLDDTRVLFSAAQEEPRANFLHLQLFAVDSLQCLYAGAFTLEPCPGEEAPRVAVSSLWGCAPQPGRFFLVGRERNQGDDACDEANDADRRWDYAHERHRTAIVEVTLPKVLLSESATRPLATEATVKAAPKTAPVLSLATRIVGSVMYHLRLDEDGTKALVRCGTTLYYACYDAAKQGISFYRYDGAAGALVYVGYSDVGKPIRRLAVLSWRSPGYLLIGYTEHAASKNASSRLLVQALHVFPPVTWSHAWHDLQPAGFRAEARALAVLRATASVSGGALGGAHGVDTGADARDALIQAPDPSPIADKNDRTSLTCIPSTDSPWALLPEELFECVLGSLMLVHNGPPVSLEDLLRARDCGK